VTRWLASSAWLIVRPGMAVDLDDEDVDDEATPPPARLAAAAEALLALAVGESRPGREVSDADRLLDVLMLVGRLHGLCTTHAGFFSSDLPPVDDDERAWVAERDLAFVCRCADELVELAAGCVRFAVALWVDLRPDWEDPPDARQEAVAEAREEILSELGILAGRPPSPPLTAGKYAVAEFVRPTLLFAALACADAAHELTDERFPGTAGGTMLGLAASLLTDGDQIATVAGYESWPEIGED
jgi:hypothetical protein